MGPRNKAVVAGLAALIAVTAVVVVVRARGADEPLAQLDVTRQSVEIDRAAAGNRTTAASSEAQDLAVGDRVTTDEEGLGTINWFDGSLTRLGQNAEFTVAELGSETNRAIVGHLEFGASWHRVQRVSGSGSRFEIQTSNAIAAVRGTTFLVRCIPTCRFGVVEGQIRVLTDDGDETALNEGEQVDVDAQGNLGEIEPLDTDDPWVQMNKELDDELDDDSTDGQTDDESDTNGTATNGPTTTTAAPSDPPVDDDPFEGAPPTTSNPRSRSFANSGGAGSDDEPPATTPPGTIVGDPPPTPTTTVAPDSSSTTSTSAPATTSSSTTPTTAPTTTSSSTTSTSAPTTTSSSTTSSSTTSTSTTSTSAPTTTTPPTTSAPVTSPPAGGGGGGGTPSTTAPSTTTTTEPPEETGSISGTVFDPDPQVESSAATSRQPLALETEPTGGVVFACLAGAEGEDVVCPGAEVAIDGTYSITDLTAGAYDVFARPPTSRTDLGVSETFVVELEAGTDVSGVDLTFTLVGPELFPLAGTVHDHTGGAVASATVKACSLNASAEGIVIDEERTGCPTVTTNETGAFSFSLPSGDYSVEATFEGLSASETVTIPTEMPLPLALPAPPIDIIGDGFDETSPVLVTELVLAPRSSAPPATAPRQPQHFGVAPEPAPPPPPPRQPQSFGSAPEAEPTPATESPPPPPRQAQAFGSSPPTPADLSPAPPPPRQPQDFGSPPTPP